ncbi:MAG: carboxypeptidase-like regulatory domain-containing protein [Eudoraea sp.]|nr:carboxypeptidase-like regulatory domain-containing protein [Eudoraea sp.]
MIKQILLLGTFLICFAGFSQETTGSIKGHVIDGETFGESLVFAHVQLKNTTEATQTNFHGNFEITELMPGEYTLTIAFPGYKSHFQNIKVKEGLETRISLSLNALVLEAADASDITGLDKRKD